MKITNFFLLTLLQLLLSFPLAGQSKEDATYFQAAFIKKAMTKALDWQLAHPKHPLWDWTNGAFYTGVYSAYQTLKAPYILDSLMAMGNRNQWKPGPRVAHADDWVICQTYIDLYRIKKDPKVLQAFNDTLKLFNQSTNVEAANNGLTWWWCDALFMAPPALVKLGITLNDQHYLTLADSMFQQTYDKLYDKNEHLFARDASYLWTGLATDKKETNGKKIFWGRGNGWVMGGLVKMLSDLPATYPKRNFYITLYKQIAERLADLQQPDGLWRTSLLNPEAYPGGEASGTGFYCYALAWGINQGILDKSKFLPIVKKAWIGLCRVQKESGMIGWVQPIGADPQKNFSADSWEVYGTGAFLSAGSEIIKMK